MMFPKKQTKGTKSADFCTWQGGEGVKKSESFADVIYGSPLAKVHLFPETERPSPTTAGRTDMHLIADLEQEETINPRLLLPPTPQPGMRARACACVPWPSH